MVGLAAPPDPIVDLVTRLQTCAAGGRSGRPERVWDWTCEQLLQLLESYPGGVTEMVAQTHLYAHSLSANKVQVR